MTFGSSQDKYQYDNRGVKTSRKELFSKVVKEVNMNESMMLQMNSYHKRSDRDLNFNANKRATEDENGNLDVNAFLSSSANPFFNPQQSMISTVKDQVLQPII